MFFKGFSVDDVASAWSRPTCSKTFLQEKSFSPSCHAAVARQTRHSLPYEVRLFDPHSIFTTSFDICSQNEANRRFFRGSAKRWRQPTLDVVKRLWKHQWKTNDPEWVKCRRFEELPALAGISGRCEETEGAQTGGVLAAGVSASAVKSLNKRVSGKVTKKLFQPFTCNHQSLVVKPDEDLLSGFQSD